jgi:hypothetical protein
LYLVLVANIIMPRKGKDTMAGNRYVLDAGIK